MQDFTDFAIRHWELCLTFVLILVYWLVSEYLEHRGGHGITPVQLVHLMNRENAAVIDLRETKYFEEGHILGALSFPARHILDNLNKLKKYQSKSVVLVDNNGSASSRLLNQMIAKGFVHTKYLKNGLTAWNQQKLPLNKLEKGGKSHGKD
jgi:rhodanese-related sulfurtransferase